MVKSRGSASMTEQKKVTLFGKIAGEATLRYGPKISQMTSEEKTVYMHLVWNIIMNGTTFNAATAIGILARKARYQKVFKFI